MSTYIVGVDGSTPSVSALAWAMKRAEVLINDVRLIHVIEDEWGLVGGDFIKEAIAAGEAVIAAALVTARQIAPEVHLSSQILHGSPVWELSHTCEMGDLLVVGTHKTGFLHGRVLGSRSVSIAALAQCSVVVVPDGQSRARVGVVAGVAGAGLSNIAITSAARDAARFKQSLTLVHAASSKPADFYDATALREAQRALMNQATEVATGVAPGTEMHTRISLRSPAEALLDASQNATLLVMEPSREQDLARNLLGSTTHDVLMNINVPVLVARSNVI